MHGPTCIFWANLTPFSPQAGLYMKLVAFVAATEAVDGSLRSVSELWASLLATGGPSVRPTLSRERGVSPRQLAGRV